MIILYNIKLTALGYSLSLLSFASSLVSLSVCPFSLSCPLTLPVQFVRSIQLWQLLPDSCVLSWRCGPYLLCLVVSNFTFWIYIHAKDLSVIGLCSNSSMNLAQAKSSAFSIFSSLIILDDSSLRTSSVKGKIATEEKSQLRKNRNWGKIATEEKSPLRKNRNWGKIATEEKSQLRKNRNWGKIATEEKSQLWKNRNCGKIATEEKSQLRKNRNWGKIATEEKSQLSLIL